MRTCKHCGSSNIRTRKQWTLIGKIINKATQKPYEFLITIWECLSCKKTFRTSESA